MAVGLVPRTPLQMSRVVRLAVWPSGLLSRTPLQMSRVVSLNREENVMKFCFQNMKYLRRAWQSLKCSNISLMGDTN